MNKKLAAAMVALLTLGMTASAAAQISGDDASGESEINVTVSSSTALDVRPSSLDFTGLSVGTQQTEDNGTNKFGALELENIGSEYIDRVWASATKHNDDPFATGNPGEYNAGNFLQIKPANSTAKTSVRGNTSTYHYVNRVEYANSWKNERGSIPSYIEAAPGNVGGSDDTYVGRFRAGDEWYFWVIPVGSDDVCDGSQAGSFNEIRVGNSAHSANSAVTDGTTDFTDSGPGNYTTYDIVSGSGAYGIAANEPATHTGVRLNFTDSGDTFYREYDVLTACDTSKAEIDQAQAVRTRYNVQAGDSQDLTAGSQTGNRTQFLLSADSANPGRMLLPGEGISIDTAIEVPQGVPQGEVTSGTLTFFVTSDTSASVTG